MGNIDCQKQKSDRPLVEESDRHLFVETYPFAGNVIMGQSLPDEVKEGDRIAQLVLEKIALADVAEVDDLDETVRGAGGFGSTGVK